MMSVVVGDSLCIDTIHLFPGWKDERVDLLDMDQWFGKVRAVCVEAVA